MPDSPEEAQLIKNTSGISDGSMTAEIKQSVRTDESVIPQEMATLIDSGGRLTPNQEARANVAFYNTILDAFSRACKDYRRERAKTTNAEVEYVPANDQQRLVLETYEDGQNIHDLEALEEIYRASFREEISDEEAVRRWGPNGKVYREMVYKLLPSIEKSKEDILNEIPKWSPLKSLNESRKAIFKFPFLSDAQQARMLLLAGYGPDEVPKLLVKLGLSAGLSAGLGVFYEQVGLAAAAAGAALRFNQSLELMFLSVGLYYGAMIIGAEVNLRLLKNKNIGTSPNVTETGAYYLLDKLLPPVERFPARTHILDWGTRIGAIPMEIIKEAGWWGSALVPEVGISAFTAANMAGIGLNTLQAIYAKDMVKPENQERILGALNTATRVMGYPVEGVKRVVGHFRHSSKK